MRGILAILSRSKITILYRLFVLTLFSIGLYYIGNNVIFEINGNISIDIEKLRDISNYQTYEKDFIPRLIVSIALFGNILYIIVSNIIDVINIALHYGHVSNFFRKNKIKLEQKYILDFEKITNKDILKYIDSLYSLRKIKKRLKKNKKIDDNFFLDLHNKKLTLIQDELADYNNLSSNIIKYSEEQKKGTIDV
jgi:hypothetical protein